MNLFLSSDNLLASFFFLQIRLEKDGRVSEGTAFLNTDLGWSSEKERIENR
jgi:hypothetical protein